MVVVLSNRMTFERTTYYRYIYQKRAFNKAQVISDAYNTLEKSFKRMIQTLPPDYQIALPLSGGYDSRLIACLCKKYDLKNIVCYTYGRPDSFEVITSKKVAETLGFEWHYVEYTPEKLAYAVKSQDFKIFSNLSSNCNSIPHVQDFLALKELVNHNIIHSHAIVIPGFCGDLFGGSKVPREVFEWGEEFNHKNFASLVYKHFYDLNTPKARYKNDILNKISNGISEYETYTTDDFLNHYEQWCIENRLSKYIINSLRVYEFFELDWRILLWDDEYAKTWYLIPWQNKSAKLLSDFMFESYFNMYDVNMRKPLTGINLYSLNRLKQYIPSFIKEIVNIIRRNMFMRKSRLDFNCFNQAAGLLSNSDDIDYVIKYLKSTKVNNIMAVLAYKILSIFKINQISMDEKNYISCALFFRS